MDFSKLSFDDRDEFSRKSVAKKAIKLLRSNIEVSPMVIDGNWGAGKTEFCHKMKNLMSNDESHHLIYIDAFKEDNADAPLLSVIAEVIKLIPEGKQRDNFIQKAIPALRFSLKALFKAGVGHLLRQDFADVANDFDKDIQKAADKAIDFSTEALLKDHIEAEKNLKALRDALTSLAQKKPIIIFIDELDRCRPDFSLNMLEVVKHTFDIECVQFVLITNSIQLKASINHRFGDINADVYLDKFIKFHFTIPERIRSQRAEDAVTSYEHFKNLITVDTALKDIFESNDKEYIFELVHQIIIENQVSLREVESFVRHLCIYIELSEDNGFLNKNKILGYRLLTVFAILVFSLNKSLSIQFLTEKVNAEMLSKFVGVANIAAIKFDHYPKAHEVISVMLGRESNINRKLFMPHGQEQTEEWNSIINGYFRGSYGINNSIKSKIVTEVLNQVSLN